ncbi:MAG TPA: hypothetical protein V6C97_05455 [Oculatellaceae cyanobacterium]
MQPNQDDEDENEHAPKLQLEYSGGGPGPTMRTAVGVSDGDNYISGAWLPAPPWWFFVLEQKQIELCRKRFHLMPLPEALACLECAGVPPIARLVVGLRWAFIDPNRDGFSRQELKELIIDAELGIDPSLQVPKRFTADNPGLAEDAFEMQLQSIESAVVYRLWRHQQKANPVSRLSNFNKGHY